MSKALCSRTREQQDLLVIPADGKRAPKRVVQLTESLMSVKRTEEAPTGYLAYNTESGGWRVYHSRVRAQQLRRRKTSIRVYPIWGDLVVDDDLLRFVRWASDAPRAAHAAHAA